MAIAPEAAPLVTGLSIAAAAMASKYAIEAFQKFLAAPRVRTFYKGGFRPVMDRREAALILGIRESAAHAKVKEAHRKVMAANHPDVGGSDYLASKINEAKDVLLGQSRNNHSAF